MSTPADQRADQRTVPAVLNRAAALIETYGHAVGWYEVDGAYCVLGAIRAAVYGTPEPDFSDESQGPHDDLYVQTTIGLGGYLHGVGDSVFEDVGGVLSCWSDSSRPERVVELLRAAAAVA